LKKCFPVIFSSLGIWVASLPGFLYLPSSVLN
jgi:hypothetical protein